MPADVVINNVVTAGIGRQQPRPARRPCSLLGNGSNAELSRIRHAGMRAFRRAMAATLAALAESSEMAAYQRGGIEAVALGKGGVHRWLSRRLVAAETFISRRGLEIYYLSKIG